MINAIMQHPYAAIVVISFINQVITGVWSAFVSSLPAPTKDAKPKYIFWFKFCNRLSGNLSRARSTAIEQSPNWYDAIKRNGFIR